jgi:hypothetical protein
MPGATLPGNHTATFGKTIARVERIERNTQPLGVDAAVTMVFSYPGTLTANITSPPWYVPRSGIIDSVRVSLTGTATSTHSVTVNVNGTSQGTFTCTSGLKTLSTTAAISVAFGDYATITTSAVTDSNLAVELRLR